jgi:hypothetical protein
VQPETDIHKPQGLPKASSCFAAVYGRIIDNPNNYAARLNQSPKLLRDAFKVPRMPAVGPKVIVWWRRNNQVYRLARHGSHHLAIVAANYSVGFHRVYSLKQNSIALASQPLYFPVLRHKQIENFLDQPFLCVFAQWHHYETPASLKIQDLRNVNGLACFVNYAPLACAVASVFDNA